MPEGPEVVAVLEQPAGEPEVTELVSETVSEKVRNGVEDLKRMARSWMVPKRGCGWEGMNEQERAAFVAQLKEIDWAALAQ